MHKERKIWGTIKAGHAGHSGTEMIKANELLQVSKGKSVELVLEGDGITITLNLYAVPNDKYGLRGSFVIKETMLPTET